MKSAFLPDAEQYRRAHRRRRIWYRVVTGLAAVVVFCTTYALILPAITLENTYACQQTEHTHGEDCWGTTLVEQVTTTLTCAPEVHSHSPECYDDTGQLTCGLADRLLHSHDASCYDDTGQLICTLPEVTEHLHGDGCWLETQKLTCGQEETYHVHGEDCFTAQRGQLTCTLEEGDEHRHTDECYAWEQVLTCEVPEDPAGHRHSEDCYELTRTLICPLEQIAAHEHGPDCCDETGALVCGILSAQTHRHTEDCRLTSTDTREETVLTCPLAEHLHTDECLPAEDPEAPDEAAGPEETPPEEETPEEPDGPEYRCGWEEHTHEDLCYDESGALICGRNAHHHGEECLAAPLPTAEEQAASASAFSAALEDLTAEQAPDVLTQLSEAHGRHQLSDVAYLTLSAQVQALLDAASDPDVDLDGVAEAAEGTNWMRLRDSGWFEEYSAAAISSYSLSAYSGYALRAAQAGDTSPSAVQIDSPGGEESSDDVTVSKTIAGTDIENVFDITLTVQTPQKIDQVISEPDMAVVIVMDISNTMNDNFGGVTRYAAAMEAAEDFLDNFAANNTLGVSKVGYVAFNTDAHQIFGLQSCTNETQANVLKNTMRTATGNIINNYEKNDKGNVVGHDRFTNIEGGLKMAQDMLDGVSNKNKFIILLTDGFPTTYLESGYKGYDPYDTTGRFYDHVLNKKCLYGTSYSDEAAIRARNMAASIKNSGTTIFSIGVDVGGQTIQEYINDSTNENATKNNYSVVDRTSESYEIGDATSTDAYKNWLKNSIGSGYYYDSTNTAGLKEAYNQIFAQIKTTIETAAKADWVATDPIPSVSRDGEVEFIGLYDKSDTLKGNALTGSHAENGENTASYATEQATISWDLKESGYTTATDGTTTTYTYQLKYRVRLTNEDSRFVEKKVYDTNGTTTLQYRVVQTVDGTTTISDEQTIEFPVPSVHGFMGELTFDKKDSYGRAVAGAEFTLSHDSQCNICRGDKTQVTIDDQKATSGEDGTVKFEKIPSGHTYTLTETKIPDGYSTDGSKYTVTVAYDEVTVKKTDSGNNPKKWDGTIVNHTSYTLPNTGGSGTQWYYIAGTALIAAAGLLYSVSRRRRGAHSPR